MNQLEHKYNIIENGGIETALDVQSKQQNFFHYFVESFEKISWLCIWSKR